MEKKSSSSSSSEDIESDEAQAEAGACKLNACFLVEAVKGIILKCFGVLSNVQEPCLSSSDPAPSTSDPSPTTAVRCCLYIYYCIQINNSTYKDKAFVLCVQQGDGAGVSLATPPRPGGSTGPGPQIN